MNKGKVVSVISSRGGSGKTITALLLATYLNETPMKDKDGAVTYPKVVLVDFDLRDGQIGYFTNHNYPISTNEPALFKSADGEKDVLLFPKLSSPFSYIEKASVEKYRKILKELTSEYDYVVVDTSSNLLDPLLKGVVYPDSDTLLCVADPAPLIFEELPQFLKSLDNDNVGIVLNKGTADVDIKGFNEARGEVPVLTVLPADYESVTEATKNDSVPSLVKLPKFEQALEILSIALTD